MTVAALRRLTQQHAAKVQQVERMEEMQREKLRDAEVPKGRWWLGGFGVVGWLGGWRGP